MAIFGGKAAADIEAGERHADAIAHPVRGGQRPLIGVGILDLAADMEADTDLVADACRAAAASSTAWAGAAPNFFDSS